MLILSTSYTLSKYYNIQKKIIKVDHKIQGCIIFGQIVPGYFFGKIDYRYFCQSVVPHYTKRFQLKKFLQRIRICKVLQFWSKFGPNCRVFPTGAESKEESNTGQKFAHSLPIPGKISLLVESPNKCLFSSTKYQRQCFNLIKTSFLGFYLLPLLLLHFILTLYCLYSQVMLILTLINVRCLENVVNFEKGSNSQNYPSSDSHNPIKIFFIAKFTIAFTWNGENKTIKTSF